ncbi:SURF1 family protein [Acuticoccus kandeliae]|uniref:SURF1 family protein n=1 Tax=Acuticoccus kandeliae TaxID=2073160 RepID=UPI00130065B2|nr:SURF1 family protein [Acuticoccus kandeliae]
MAPRTISGARVLLALLILSAFAILVGLGTWQLQRLAWKEALIATAGERPGLPAVAPPGPGDWAAFDIKDWDFRRVRLTGTFGEKEAHAWAVLAEPHGPLGGAGEFVVAPLTTAEGWSVLVNRGFVPEAQKDRSTRHGSEPPSGPVTIEGIIRRDDTPGMFTPDPDPAANRFYGRHIATLARFLGLDPAKTAPYSIDLVASETPPGGLPQAGESVVTFRNPHLQYALTWYGLAAALVGVVIAVLVKRRREGRAAKADAV